MRSRLRLFLPLIVTLGLGALLWLGLGKDPYRQDEATLGRPLPTWQSDLLRHLGKFKRYPEDARRRGLQGINRLRFVVDAEGKILSYSLAGGSGSAALDRATLEMIRKAQPVPKPPQELLNNGSIEVVAPFVYSLDKKR